MIISPDTCYCKFESKDGKTVSKEISKCQRHTTCQAAWDENRNYNRNYYKKTLAKKRDPKYWTKKEMEEYHLGKELLKAK